MNVAFCVEGFGYKRSSIHVHVSPPLPLVAIAYSTSLYYMYIVHIQIKSLILHSHDWYNCAGCGTAQYHTCEWVEMGAMLYGAGPVETIRPHGKHGTALLTKSYVNA